MFVRPVSDGRDGAQDCAVRVVVTVELGHVFKLGRRYSETMHARVLDSNGKEGPLVMSPWRFTSSPATDVGVVFGS